MKYIDKEGKVHYSKLSWFGANIGIVNTGLTPEEDEAISTAARNAYQKAQDIVNGRDPDASDEPDEPIDLEPVETIDIVELHGDKIIGKTKEGKVVREADVQDHAAFAAGWNLVQESVESIDMSDDAIQRVIGDILIDKEDLIADLSKLYVDGSSDMEAMLGLHAEAMSSLTSSAIWKYPAYAVNGNGEFLQKLLSSFNALLKLHSEKQ